MVAAWKAKPITFAITSTRFSIDPDSDGRGVTDIVRGHRHVVTKTGDSFVIGPPTGALRARVPSYGEIQFYDRSGEKKEEGIDIGAERIDTGGYGSAGIARVIGSGPWQSQDPARLRRRGHVGGRRVHLRRMSRPQRYAKRHSRRPLAASLSLLQGRHRIGHSRLDHDEASDQGDRKQSDPLRGRRV